MAFPVRALPTGISFVKTTGRYKYFYDLPRTDQGKRTRVFSQLDYGSVEYAVWARDQFKQYVRATGNNRLATPSNYYRRTEGIAGRRCALGLTQHQLGHLAGIDEKTVRTIELGMRKPHAVTLIRLARVFQCSPIALAQEIEATYPTRRHETQRRSFNRLVGQLAQAVLLTEYYAGTEGIAA